MNRKSTAEKIRSHLASADPAAHITDHELARSRERSLRAIRSLPVSAKDAALNTTEPLPAVSTPSSWRTRRTRTWLTAAAAAAVVAGLIAGDVVGLAGWRGGATAQAAEVLNKAAQTAITATDPVVNPGQYLRIKSINVWMTETMTEDHSRYQWLDTEKFDMYIPANRSDEWVWQRSGRVPTTYFDPKAEEYVLEQNIQAHPELLRAPKGEFYGTAGGWLSTDMAAFPREPVPAPQQHLQTNPGERPVGRWASVGVHSRPFENWHRSC